MTKFRYPLVSYPEHECFREMSLDEGEAFFGRFLRAIPERISVLEHEVQRRNKSTWKADCEPRSLDALTSFLKLVCRTRPMTEKELRDAARGADRKMRDLIRRQRILNGESKAVASDVGIYVAECLIKKHTRLYWGRVTKPINNIVFNRPVLLGFPLKHRIEFEPIGAGEVQGLQAVESDGQCDVRGLFEGWSRHARGKLDD